MNNMRILFVANHIGFIEPLGMMLISALAKKHGHETFLAILSSEDALGRARKIKPDMVCYSVTTGEQSRYLNFNKKLKKEMPGVFSIMGGMHPTFFPEVVNEGDLDAVCIGEGDEAFPELLELMAEGRSLAGMKNILLAGENPAAKKIRPLFQNLDSLPYPDRELIYGNKNTGMAEFPMKSFMRGRGCAFACTYCFNKSYRDLYNNKMPYVRTKSVEKTIAEIKEVKNKYCLDFIKFYDDIFAYKADEWLRDFVKIYKQEINIPFQCLLRVNLVTEDMVKLLKEAGCKSVSLSIEAGNPEAREKILNRNMTNEEIIRGFHLFYKYGIPVFCNNIFALPGYGLQYDIETLDLNIKSKVTYALFGSLFPYPGTEAEKFCKEKGYLSPKQELHFSYQSRSPLNCFTEKEKDRSYKLSVLGTVAVAYPKTRNFIVKYLDYIPNFLAFWAFNIVQGHLIRTKIYPTKMGILKSFKYFLKNIRLERARRNTEKIKQQ